MAWFLPRRHCTSVMGWSLSLHLFYPGSFSLFSRKGSLHGLFQTRKTLWPWPELSIPVRMIFHCCSCSLAAPVGWWAGAPGSPLGLSSVALLDHWWALSACPLSLHFPLFQLWLLLEDKNQAATQISIPFQIPVVEAISQQETEPPPLSSQIDTLSVHIP